MAPRGAMMGIERMRLRFGEIGKMAGLNDLQLPESDHQKHDEGYREVGKKRQPALRDFLVVNVP